MPFKTSELIPASSVFNRWVLDALVLFNAIAQGVLVVVILMGPAALTVLPVAGAAVITLFLLMFFYTRWLVPVLDRRQVLTIILLKELGLFALLGLGLGLLLLLYWLVG